MRPEELRGFYGWVRGRAGKPPPRHMAPLSQSQLTDMARDQGLRVCGSCGCIGSYGVCHCDADVFGPECFTARGRHEKAWTG